MKKTRVIAGAASALVLTGGCLVGSALPAAAVEKGQCVVYADGPFNQSSGQGVTAHGSGVCSNAKSVTGKFLERYRNITGWHTAYNISKSFGNEPDGFDLGWHAISTATVTDVYIEATVCYKWGSTTKCRSDSKSVHLN